MFKLGKSSSMEVLSLDYMVICKFYGALFTMLLATPSVSVYGGKLANLG